MEQRNYRFDVRPRVFTDMDKIISNFLMLGSTKGANRMREKFYKVFDLILTFPYCGKIVPDDELASRGFRMMVVEKYIMIYTISEKEKKVTFHRVFDGRTDYRFLLGGNSDDTENEEEK